VVLPTDSARSRKNSPVSLSHSHSANTVLNGSSATSPRPKSPETSKWRHAETAKNLFSHPGDSVRPQARKSKPTSSVSRFEKEPRRSVAIHGINLSPADLSADDVLMGASRKVTATEFSCSDINRIVMAEVKKDNMSRDLAKLVMNLSKEESHSMPLPRTKVNELRSWMSATDSNCSKLPVSVQNNLNYIIQVNDGEYSAANKSRNPKISNVGFSNINVQSVSAGTEKPKLSHQYQRDALCSAAVQRLSRKLGLCDQSSRPTSGSRRTFLSDETRQRKLDDDVGDVYQRTPPSKRSGSFVTGSRSYSLIVADEDEAMISGDTHHLMSRRNTRDITSLEHLSNRRPLATSKNKGHTRDKRPLAKQLPVTNATTSLPPSFEERAQEKSNRTLQTHHTLRNTGFPKSYKSSTSKYLSSKYQKVLGDKRSSENKNTGLQRHRVQRSASSSTNEDDSLNHSGMPKLLCDQNFSGRSHFQKTEQQKAGKSWSSEFNGSIRNRSSSVTAQSSNSSVKLRESHTQCQMASKKATSVSAFRRSCLGRARIQDSRTFGKTPQAPENTSSPVGVQLPSSLSSSKTQHSLIDSKAHKAARNNTSLGISPRKRTTPQSNKPTILIAPPTDNSKKVPAVSRKDVNESCEPSSQLGRSSKLTGRWSDLGSWNGKVYSIQRVTSGSKTSNSVDCKQHKKGTEPPLKSAASDSKTKTTTNNEPLCQQASDKSSVETVISRVTSKPSLNVDSHKATSISLNDKSSPHFKIHSPYHSDSNATSLKRHVVKPSPAGLEPPKPKSRISACSKNTEKKSPQRQTVKIPKSVACCRDRQKVSSCAESEASSSPIVTSETAEPDADEETGSIAALTKKRCNKPDADKKRVRSLSDTESAVSDSTFVAEKSCNYNMPPRTWLGSWWPKAATGGSRSSLNTTTDREDSDDTLSVTENERCICGLAKVASFDRAVSTDSEPELSTTMLETENSDEKYYADPDIWYSVQSCDVLSRAISQRHCRGASPTDQQFQHRFDVNRKDILSADAEDIQMEPFPPSLFSLSSIDVAIDADSDDEYNDNMTENERTASISSSKACMSDNGLLSTENKVKTIFSEKKSDEKGAEDRKVPRKEGKNAESKNPEVSAVESRKCLFNENVNHMFCSTTSDSSLLSSDVQKSNTDQSSECRDTEKTSSSRSLAEMTYSSVSSDNNSSTSLYRQNMANKSRWNHDASATFVGCQHGTSLPFIPDGDKEGLPRTNLPENFAKSKYSAISDSSSSTSLPRDCNTTNKYRLPYNASTTFVGSQHGRSLPVIEDGEKERLPHSYVGRNTADIKDCIISDSSSSTSLTRYNIANKSRLTHDPSATFGCLQRDRPVIPDNEKKQFEKTKFHGNANIRDCLPLQSNAHDMSSKSNTKVDSDNSLSKSNDMKSKLVDFSSRSRPPKFKCDIGRFIDKATLLHIPSTPGKRAFSGDDISAKQADKELSNNESGQNVLLSDSSATIDSESLKAAVKNALNSKEYHETSAGNNYARNTDAKSISSSQSLKENVEKENTPLTREEQNLLPKAEVPGSHEIDVLSSSSSASEPESPTTGSLVDDSTGLNTISSSDTGCVEICPSHLLCDPPSSSSAHDDCVHASFAGTDCGNSQCTSRSSDRSIERDDRTTDRTTVCCDKLAADSLECASNVDKRGTCGVQTSRTMSNPFAARFDELQPSVPRSTEYRQIADARSQRITNCRNTPAADIFARHSMSAFHREGQRNSSDFVASIRRQNIADIRAAASKRENVQNSSHIGFVHHLSNAKNDVPCEHSDDRAFPCNVTSRSLIDVPKPKVKAKVRCKSSYMVKLRRQAKRGHRSTPVKCRRESGSSDAEEDHPCRVYIPQRHDVDNAQEDMKVCQEVKRISCSQLYRMSRAGATHDGSTSDSDVRNIVTPTTCWAEDPTKSPSANINTGMLGAAEGHNPQLESHDGIVSSSKGDHDKTDTHVAGQMTKVTLSSEPAPEDRKRVESNFAVASERSDSVDVVATQQTEDSADVVASTQLLLQKNTVSGVSGVECIDALGDYTELSKSNDEGAKLEGNPETPTGNSNRRTPSPSHQNTDDTASSPSVSFSLSATEALSDDFLEVLSSRLLVAMSKKQRQSQSVGAEESGLEVVKTCIGEQAMNTMKSTVAGPTAAKPECVNPLSANIYSSGVQQNMQDCHLDCSDYDKMTSGTAYYAGVNRRAPIIDGSEAAAERGEWTSRRGHNEHMRQGPAELWTTSNGAETDNEVDLCL